MNIYIITNDKTMVDLDPELSKKGAHFLAWGEDFPEINPYEATFFLLDYDDNPSLAQSLLSQLRSHGAVVALLSATLSADKISEHQHSSASADAYITKPLDVERLYSLIADFEKSWVAPTQEGASIGADFKHPAHKKIQAQFDAVFNEEEGTDSSEFSLGDSMSEIDNGGTSPTMSEKLDDLDFGDDIELDAEETLSDVSSGGDSTEPGSGMDLSLNENLSFDEDAESIQLDLENDSEGLDEGEETVPAPPTPTETKLKLESDDLDLDLDLEENADEFAAGISEVSATDDLEAELSDEASTRDNFSLEDDESPPPILEGKEKSKIVSNIEVDEDFDNVEDDILSSIEMKEPTLNNIKNEDSVKFYRGEENPAEIVKKNLTEPAPSSSISQRVMSSLDQLPSGGGEDLVRTQMTLRHLRAEREQMLKDLSSLKTEKKFLEQDNLGLKAEIDELKIELSILKKRNNDEVSELRYHARVADEKKALLEEKVKTFQKEFDRVNQKVRVDINQVKQREKDLEGKLELMAMDSANQIQSRDNKILELKRKIDALEFNMENISIQEQKAKDDKTKVEERLRKIVKTLRGSIKLLEDDIDLNQDFLEEIKKM